jgi:hypothetical protein
MSSLILDFLQKTFDNGDHTQAVYDHHPERLRPVQSNPIQSKPVRSHQFRSDNPVNHPSSLSQTTSRTGQNQSKITKSPVDDRTVHRQYVSTNHTRTNLDCTVRANMGQVDSRVWLQQAR